MGIWAISFGVAYFGALSVNTLASAREQNCAAVNLALAFFVAWGVTNGLRGALPLPWAWLPAGVIDLALMAAAIWVGKHVRSLWPWIICTALLVGLILQVALWASWWPHRREAYNWTIYRIFNHYWQVTTALASVELLCLFWPGGQILVRSVPHWLGSLYAMPHSRRSGV